MKKVNNISIFLTAAVILSSAACKKTFDINQNPNSVTESNITAELILPNALNNVGVQTANGYGWLSNWVGYWSPSGSYSPSTEESTYNITSSFGEAKWDGVYNALYDLDVVEKKSLAANQPFYRGVALIMKAHLFQNLVDIFGDVPYSEAFQGTKNPTPKYDKASDIYKSLQARLDTAVNIMKTVTIAPKSTPTTVDIVFKGNTQQWIKLANTLKLRMLIRQSEVSGFNPTPELAKIQANGGVLQSGESASAAPGYVNDVGKQSPFYASYGLQPSGTQANEYYRANNYILGVLKNNSDPRLGYFFAPASSPASASNPYVGTTYGAPPDDAVSGTRTSNIGPGLLKSFSQPQWIVTSVESLFLQAEATARGWLPGDAKTTYQNAVKESFIWLGVTNAETAANNYLNSASIANWNNSGATNSDRAKFIANQKYIALTGINPLEAWNDYRRLGVPTNIPISVNPAKISNVLPVRLLYPASEVAVNSANVPSNVNRFTSRVFWDVN